MLSFKEQLRRSGSVGELNHACRRNWSIQQQSYKYSEHLSEADRELLEKDLDELADKFDLDWTDEGEDYGLIVGALCYRLTPSNLIHDWDEIKYSVSKTRTPGVRIFLNHRRDAVDNFIQSIVIA
jgi:hypothetical protein